MENEKLTDARRKRLKELEDSIEANLVKAGSALKTVRDLKTYADIFDTFEDYCQNVCGFDSDFANAMIARAEALS